MDLNLYSYLNSVKVGNSSQAINNVSKTVNSNSSFADILQLKLSEASQNNTKNTSSKDSMESIFKKASETYGIPKNLLTAVAYAESGFRTDAVSKCGAQGVMQLMPATAKSLGVTDPFDAEQNIMGGSKYLGQMLNKYNGNVKLALAAYNAGSGNVDKYGGIPPFEETQNYVDKVMKYAGENIEPSYEYTSQASEYANIIKSISDYDSFTKEDYRILLTYLLGAANDSGFYMSQIFNV